MYAVPEGPLVTAILPPRSCQGLSLHASHILGTRIKAYRDVAAISSPEDSKIVKITIIVGVDMVLCLAPEHNGDAMLDRNWSAKTKGPPPPISEVSALH